MNEANGHRGDRPPYVGPHPFEAEDRWRFFGRDREVADLRDLLVAHRIVLFYSPSGAGKTSLIKAALIPALEEAGLRALPVMRVHLQPDQPTGNGVNRYLYSALLSLEESLPAAQRRSPRDLATMDFAAYLDERERLAADDTPYVLIFDQFEEILTLDPTDLDVKQEFFAQVGAALRNRRRWALFSLREDYRAGLDPYLRFIPTGGATTSRLDLLKTEAATEPIQEPPRAVGVRFQDAAAAKLVEDLSRVRVEQDGVMAERPGPYVEPVQLQAVCLRIWDRLPPGTTEIAEAQVAAAGNVDTALADYYRETVAAVAAQTRVPERAIREWIDRQLITGQGIRGQVLLEQDRSQGLDNRAIEALVDAHLVRKERRRGVTWIELAHDRLIDPVRKDNAAWAEANLSVLQRGAAVWVDHGRSPELLLMGRLLSEAEWWAGAHPAEVLPAERAFLDASRQARDRAKRNRLIGSLLVAALVLLSAWSLVSWRAAEDAKADAEAATLMVEAEQQRTLARQVAAEAAELVDDRIDTAVLLSLEANRLAGTPIAEARGSLLAGVGSTSSARVAAFLRGHRERIDDVTYNPKGNLIASASQDGAIIVWGADSGTALGPPLAGPPTGVNDLAFADDKTLAAAGQDGSIVLWDVATGQPIGDPLIGTEGAVYSLSFSPDGTTLASGGADGKIRLWDVAARQQTGELTVSEAAGVSVVAFHPTDRTTLASASLDGKVLLWNPGTGKQRGEPLPEKSSGFFSLAFAPDGETLAAGDSSGSVSIWRLRAVELEIRLEEAHIKNTGVFSLAFSPDSETLASGGTDNRIWLWDVDSGTPRERDPGFSRQMEAVYGLAYSPDGWHLASAGGDGTVVIWSTLAVPPLVAPLWGGPWEVADAVFEPGDATLVAARLDGRLSRWNLATGTGVELPSLDLPPDDTAVVALSPDGKILAAGGCGERAAGGSACTRGDVRLWSIASGAPLGEPFGEHGNWVRVLAFSPDGGALATGNDDGTIVVWDIETRAKRAGPLAAHGAAVTSLAFDPTDPTRLAAGHHGGELAVWDLATGQLVAERRGHERQVWDVAFSPRDGTLLASGSQDGTVGLWNTAAESLPGDLLAAHYGPVQSVAFSGDGGTLASASRDRSVILWDPAGRRPIGPPLYLPYAEVLSTLVFSPDGASLALGGYLHREAAMPLVVVNLDSAHWQERACVLAGRNLTLAEWEDYIGVEQPYRPQCISGLVREADAFWLADDPGRAEQTFARAVELAAEEGDADANNDVCWTGSLDGEAVTVMPACERAVELASEGSGATFEEPFYRDTRGLARALAGDLQGAREDFEAFVPWADEVGIVDDLVDKRRGWIKALQAGTNPFDAQTLWALRAEVTEIAPQDTADGAIGTPASAEATPVAPPVTSPAAATPTATSFASEQFGWRLSWSGSWELTEHSSTPGRDRLELDNGISLVWIAAYPYSGDDAESCVEDVQTKRYSHADVTHVLARYGADGQPLRGDDATRAFAVSNYTFAAEDGSRWRYAHHVECRLLPDGAVLEITMNVGNSEYDGAAEALDALLAELVLPSPTAATPRPGG